MVQYQQQHQQQPRYNQPRSQMQHFNNRPPFTERRPLVCRNCGKEGHPSRICREQPQMASFKFKIKIETMVKTQMMKIKQKTWTSMPLNEDKPMNQA
ncbi:hypothetical protein G6F51_014208 [Rhizopus arrhizus]|uniref:CCHC-type domain-containing protein n=1 Tax=Rhizopus oryzae TaxID=64495 RepID=A0A9P6XNC0_RHIOR|nr:hypothetical protein G6F51_014208 [Rhizopus arrhizus]